MFLSALVSNFKLLTGSIVELWLWHVVIRKNLGLLGLQNNIRETVKVLERKKV